MSARPTIVWFRRDLRLTDNAALTAAALKGGPVVPAYLADWEQSDPWAPGEAARWWLRSSLQSLATDLARWGSPLLVAAGAPATALVALVLATGADEVVWNRLYEPRCRDLDRGVEAALRQVGVASRSFPGALLFEPEEHLSRSGRPFVQFGAFWRSCRSLLEPERPAPGPAPPSVGAVGLDAEVLGTAMRRVGNGLLASTGWAPRVAGPADPWEPGEGGANRRLGRFLDRALAPYEQARDFPGTEGVSRLSPHLHFGEISPRQVWQSVRSAGRLEEAGLFEREAVGASGGTAFLRQLGWREFAHYLLFHFPRTPVEPFRPEFAAFPWADDPEGLAAWRRGATGYPLVDAGMRQLLTEGWVHNRVRMVMASFLSKDLLIPWQEGAAWFWDRLVDADLANNTLGWQWTAGSGPDAAPYFRVYNPELQARRFDSSGIYIRRWVPEALPEVRESSIYPPPLVDHGSARLRALAAFRGLRGRSADAPA